MADPTEPTPTIDTPAAQDTGAGQQPAEPTQPTATPAEAPNAAQEPQDTGKGSKQAVLSDLARERDARQALQAQLDAINKALNPAGTETTPEQLAEQLAAAQAETATARAEIAVVRNAPPGINLGALLDSRAFTECLKSIDTADPAAVTAAIEQHIAANPHLRATTGAGARDAAATSPAPSATKSIDDIIRGR